MKDGKSNEKNSEKRKNRKKTKQKGVCDQCSSRDFIKREDDNVDTIRNRLDVYKEKTEPLISYYENENLLKRVNAEGSMEEVYKGLLAAIYTNVS